MLALALSRDSEAALHRELLDRTVKSSLKLATGQATAAVVSTSIASLAEGVLTSMFMSALKWFGLAVLISGIAVGTAGALARQNAGPQQDEPPAATRASARSASITLPEAGAETIGGGAADVAQGQGTAPKLPDLRKELLKAARMDWELAYKDRLDESPGLERAYQASKRLMDAQQLGANSADEKSAAIKAHLDRMRDIARVLHGSPHGSASSTDVRSGQVRAYAAEGQLWLAQAATARADQAPSPEQGTAKDPKSKLVLARLDQAVAMPFFQETPLEDVLKYIKQMTTSPDFPSGIPIYVDPIGLQEVEKSLTSTVRSMDLEGIPLRRTLQLLLKQLDLIYFVEDGLLCITSSDSESGGTFGPATNETSPILQKAAKAERGELSLAEMKELIELFKIREQVMRLAAGREEAKHGAPDANRESDESRQLREQMDLLLKEMRELIELLKAEKQPKKAPAAK
jgi:hypothetical protein